MAIRPPHGASNFHFFASPQQIPEPPKDIPPAANPCAEATAATNPSTAGTAFSSNAPGGSNK